MDFSQQKEVKMRSKVWICAEKTQAFLLNGENKYLDCLISARIKGGHID